MSGASILFLINRYFSPIQCIVILIGKSADFHPCGYPSLMRTSISRSEFDVLGVSKLHSWLWLANEESYRCNNLATFEGASSISLIAGI